VILVQNCCAFRDVSAPEAQGILKF